MLPPRIVVRGEQEFDAISPLKKVCNNKYLSMVAMLFCHGGVLSQAYPQMVPDLMAYQATIIQCYRDFEYLHWAQYD